MNEDATRATRALFGRRALGHFTSDSIVDWATTCLASGLDSQSLRICAGLIPSINGFEADDYLRRALAELHFSEPPKDVALRSYVEQLAVDLIAGRIEAVACVRQLYAAYVALGYPSDLAEWLVFDDALYELERGADMLLPYLPHDLTAANYAEKVRDAAVRLLESE